MSPVFVLQTVCIWIVTSVIIQVVTWPKDDGSGDYDDATTNEQSIVDLFTNMVYTFPFLLFSLYYFGEE